MMTKIKLKNVYQVLLIYAFIITMASSASQQQFFNLTADDISKKIFTSSNYPKSYENDTLHQWLLTSSSETTVVYIELLDCLIEFTDAKVDTCELDTLRVYDGNTTSDTKLYEGCCLPDNTFTKFNSTKDTLLVEFETDATISTKGFQIEYYNSACCLSDEEAAALALALIAGIAAGGVVLITVVVISYCIYKKKCAKPTADKISIKPSGDDVAAGTSSNQPSFDYREKAPLDEEEMVCADIEGEDFDRPHPPPRKWSEDGGMKNSSLESEERRIFGTGIIPKTLPPGGAKALPPIAGSVVANGPSGNAANATHVGGGKSLLPPAPFGALPPLSELNLPKQLAKSPYGNNPRGPVRPNSIGNRSPVITETKTESNGFLAPVEL